MSAYVIARVNVTDPDQYQKYMKLSPAAVSAAGGKFIVRGGESLTLEGPDEERRVVVLEFADVSAAQNFYDSELYRHARDVRDGAAEFQMIVLEGV